METSSQRLASVDEKPATLFVALELSKSTWLAAIDSLAADKISQHRLAGGDVPGLLALIERKRSEAEAALLRPVRVMSCYEAGYDGFWLHRLLCGHGIDNRVLDAASILVDRRFRRGKTDRLDAAALLRTLMALARGEPRVCREVRAPSVAQEDERRRSRERARLVNERGQHLNRIKGLLMTQGVRDFAPARRDWRKRLDGLHTAEGRELSPCLRKEIERECRRLWLVVEMIAEVETEQQQVAEAAAAESRAAALLSRLRGVGPTTANVLADEVFFRDFKNRRELAGYFGLVASPWSSGAVNRDQGLAGSGNPRARRTALELAGLWLRHQPDSALARWFHERVGAGKGRVRKIMIVAMARKLMIALWRFLTLGVVPEGAVVKS
ncbi:MAG: IS110 family transposase [Methylocella sp.]